MAERSACCCIANKSLRAEAKPCYKCANQNKNERQRRRETEKANLKVSEREREGESARAIELGWERVKSSCGAVRPPTLWRNLLKVIYKSATRTPQVVCLPLLCHGARKAYIHTIPVALAPYNTCDIYTHIYIMLGLPGAHFNCDPDPRAGGQVESSRCLARHNPSLTPL